MEAAKAIIVRVAAAFELTPSALQHTELGLRYHALARKIAAYLVTVQTTLSLSQIARALGYRDHTSVIYACGRITDRLRHDAMLVTLIAELRATHEAQSVDAIGALNLEAETDAYAHALLAAVGAQCSVTSEDLCRRRSSYERNLAVYIVREYTTLSLDRISKLFSYTGFGTILRIHRRFAKERLRNAALRDLCDAIHAAVQADGGAVSAVDSYALAKRLALTGTQYDTGAIVNAVAHEFNVAVSELRNLRRKARMHQVRHVAAYLLRKHTRLSLSRIAPLCGFTHHTSVLHSFHRAEERLKLDSAFAERIVRIETAMDNPQMPSIVPVIVAPQAKRESDTVIANRIIDRICGAVGISRDDLIAAPRRRAQLILAKHVAVHQVHERTAFSLPQIARMFGYRDHTTIIYAHKRVSGAIAKDPFVRTLIANTLAILTEAA